MKTAIVTGILGGIGKASALRLCQSGYAVVGMSRTDSPDLSDFDGYDITWLVPTSQRLMMEPILMEISPHCQSLEDTPHDGQEFGYVLDGQVEIVYGNKVEKCKKGQAFYIETNKSHYLRNCSNRNARLIWVSTPPTF